MKTIILIIFLPIWCATLTIISLLLLLIQNERAILIWKNNDLAFAWPITSKLFNNWFCITDIILLLENLLWE